MFLHGRVDGRSHGTVWFSMVIVTIQIFQWHAISDLYGAENTHKNKNKPSYVPATFHDRKQMSAEGSNT